MELATELAMGLLAPASGSGPTHSGGRRRSSTIGAAGAVSSCSSAGPSRQWRRTQARSGASRAKGFSGRPLRRRNSATAASEPARQSSWKPPTLCRATIRPARRAAAAAARQGLSGPLGRAGSRRRGPPGVNQLSRGPQAGQPLVWAWKRRLLGSAYSEAQAAQRGKEASAVWRRSKGRARWMLKRGPQ